MSTRTDRLVQITAGRSTTQPGCYVILWDAVAVGDGARGTSISWREARDRLEPEVFSALARGTFADWCKLNGYPEEPNEAS